MKKIIINNPTKYDIELSRYGFVPYKETPTPAPSMLDAKQIFYRRCQGDKIELGKTKIVITLDDYTSDEFVILDTQQDCVQFSNQLWLTYNELIAFANKVKELKAI